MGGGGRVREGEKAGEGRKRGGRRKMAGIIPPKMDGDVRRNSGRGGSSSCGSGLLISRPRA